MKDNLMKSDLEKEYLKEDYIDVVLLKKGGEWEEYQIKDNSYL